MLEYSAMARRPDREKPEILSEEDLRELTSDFGFTHTLIPV